MAKTSGLGMGLAVAGYDLANDIGSIQRLGGGPSPLVTTGIDKSAPERIGGLLDGAIDLSAFFNDASNRAHPVFSALSTADRQVLVYLGSTIGSAAAGMIAKQLDYSGTRGADGALAFSVPHPASGYGLEWGRLLTAGVRTDTSATNGSSLDGGASTTTGWAAYLQVFDLTAVDVTITLEDSADNSSFASFTGSAFTQVTADRTVQRIAGAAGATVRRYVRAVTSTSGGMTSVPFIVMFTRRPIGS